MTSTPTPTWYDVLGVSRDASAAEIKAAWRHATDRFEPGSGSGQFRMFNDAADVLLDPERRREYDATLDAEQVAPPQGGDESAGPRTPSTHKVDLTKRERRAAEVAPATSGHDTGEEPARGGVGRALVATLGGLNLVVLVVLAVLVVALLGGAGYAAYRVEQKAAVIDARTEAPPAAERATKALFSYDYRDLDAERKRAQDYMTPEFGKKYLRNFDALKVQKDGTPGLAVQTKAVVSATVQSSGVVDAQAGVARVLVFVNLTSRKAGGDPQIFQNRVAMTMQKDGDRWLVSNVNSY